MRRVLAFALAAAFGCASPRQPPIPAPRPSPDAALDALRRAEDARAPTREELSVLLDGLRAPSADARSTAARALGRLERPALIPTLAAALQDPEPGVRAAAAIALLHSSAHGGADAARAALFARLSAEEDAVVVGALAEALGWVAHPDAARARETAEALVARSRTSEGSDAAAEALWGIAHGLYGLSRQPAARGQLPRAAVARLEELGRYGREDGSRIAAEIRSLAVMAAGGGSRAAAPVLEAALDDPDPAPRVAAARAVARSLPDSATARSLARRLLADPAPEVRALALAAPALRYGAPQDCAPYLAAAADPSLTVRLAAVDAMAAGCRPTGPAVALLDSLALALPAPRGAEAGDWHLPAHALLSLAALDPLRARARIPAFAASPDFFVRDYAARAAAATADTALLRRLAADPHPNVRTSAVAGLSSSLGRAADPVYLDALRSDDSQLLQTAAAALEGSPHPGALPALLGALDRVSAARSETSRDARVALLERVRELGDASAAPRLRPYLADFDTLLAARVADVVGGWTGTRPAAAPAPLPRAPVPTSAEIEALARARVVLEMAGGGRIVIRLFPREAPTSAARFARMAREGSLDGLTFHRVVPARLVQGGSPGANEYAGWGAYSRDELGLANRRGTVGVSTRGRDTGDGQIYINLIDGFDLDHNYTVFAEVVEGMEAVDRMQEGARILRASVRP